MSGTKNCPETPRQKMIGMMYLVLIAMLALNVSSEILNGFKLVDDSLHTSTLSINEQNDRLYQEFNALYAQNPQKVGGWLEKANLVRKEADSLFEYIHHFKIELLKRADKEKADTIYARNINKKEDLNVAPNYALTEGHGKELKEKIEHFSELMTSLANDNNGKSEAFSDIFHTGDINNKSWEIATFENMPVSAVITILSKYQNDIRNTESKMIQYLKERTDEGDARVNRFDAFVVAESNYVMEGQEYRAKILLAAVDTTKAPDVFINGNKLAGNNYVVTAGHSGEHTYSGYIELLDNLGKMQRFNFTSKYNVGKPAAIISNDDLNILYRGFDNNISISAPGIPTNNLRISVNGGTATPKGNGKYIIKPTANSVEVSVIGNIGGRQINMGSNTYRVRQLPDPKPYAAYRDNNGNIRSVFDGSVHGPTFVAGNPTVTAGYGEDALVQANFTVKSFAIRIGRRTYNSNGSKFSQEQLGIINNLPSGTTLVIQRIMAVGPDGVQRNLSAVAIEIL
ncbi:MAG: gliding motility protein GldM [Paludibacter sp.]|nr:gliding motility protein GldM [Paludibacter sp.]MDD4198045.1 gliding motility protein GldM [Paludibacter sp.]MDD4427020.1 gliding motility protein GldM [Paludibacter sp.]